MEFEVVIKKEDPEQDEFSYTNVEENLRIQESFDYDLGKVKKEENESLFLMIICTFNINSTLLNILLHLF